MRLLCDLSDDRLVDLFRSGREDAFGAMYERERRALVLRAFEGRTHAELAARLDTSVPATKALVSRARTRLRHAERAAAA